MEYPDALAWLYRTQLTGIKLGLENIQRLLAALGLPQQAGRPVFIHVAGTNGKGSVCAMIDAISRAAGRRTGLFTSPHLVSFRERIRLDGKPVSHQAVADGLTHLEALTRTWDPPPTFFELTTALACRCFAQAGVEVVVLETGLGGRLDATNAIASAVSVLTAIDFDHQSYLGNTLKEIAREKAGIIKPGGRVVSGPQQPDAAAVIEEAAAGRGAALHWVTEPVGPEYEVSLAGSHQRLNAAIAVAALDAAGLECTAGQIHAGLGSVEWPGRFQRLEAGKIVLDGAHNPAAARRLAATWGEEFGEGVGASLILGVLRDKDAVEISRALGPLAARIFTVAPASPRALPAEDLLAVLRPFAAGVEVSAAGSLADALESARRHPEPVLVAGSLFLVGEAISLLVEGAGKLEASWQ